MVAEDLELAKRDALIAKQGYRVLQPPRVARVDHQALKIYVAGHRGLVGSALVRALQSRGYERILLRIAPSSI